MIGLNSRKVQKFAKLKAKTENAIKGKCTVPKVCVKIDQKILLKTLSM